ncbi:GntR family transcriptional regulator [Oceanicella sp. SM1341]|uniref:GntR family transcriptional regulator n=1 Tax=Oceanicella sp. SM1341 TaxID=1548889 RepID=UPI0018E56659|nr:GntR family transcriptional regulator [Oceanicella sp. SM1341]
MPQDNRPPFTDRLAEDIVNGVYAPGAWLKLVDLEEQYGVSRPTVRRALEGLSTRRLVQHLPNRGYRVMQSDSGLRAEIREIRTVLEVYALDSIMARITDADIDELHALAEAFDRAITEGPRRAQTAANSAFHLRLLSICPNRTLVEEMTALRHRGPAGVPNPWSSVSQAERASRDHFLMIEALRARDTGRMKALTRHHINEISPLDPGQPDPR